MRKYFSKSKLLVFYTQLLALLKAGLPIVSSLKIIQNQSDKKFGLMIENISSNLAAGDALADLLKKHNFPNEDVNLIQIGVVSGKLEASLEKIIQYYKSSLLASNKIKKALLYPSIVLGLSFVSILFLLIFILPTFKNIFSEFNFDLPFLTKAFLRVSENWALILLFIIGMIIVSAYLFKKEEIRIKLPLIRSIYKNKMLSRICRSLGYQLKSSVPVLTAIQAVKQGINSIIYSKALDDLSNKLEQGESFSAILSRNVLFPASLIQIVKIGEESGTLDDVLIQSADYYEQETDSFIKKWITLVEPLSTLVVGGVVVLIALSMVLPLFQMMEQIQ